MLCRLKLVGKVLLCLLVLLIFAVKLDLSVLNLLFGLFKSRRSLVDLFLRVLKCRSAVIYGGLSGSYLLLGIIYCVSRIGKLSFVELKRRLCGYEIIALLEILIRGHGALAVIKFFLHSLNLRRGIRDLRFKLLILFFGFDKRGLCAVYLALTYNESIGV